MTTDDAPLLRQYVQDRCETAFAQLVSRHIDLVYATALRMTHGDSHLAQDITQLVFIHLARNAWRLPDGVVLAGWLHRHTTFTASSVLRSEQRRMQREQIAIEMSALDTEPPWESIAPHLDDALNQLSAADRNAIVLRYLKQMDFRALGAALGVSEDAAQKRASRALEKLRGVLGKRGVALSSTALAVALTTKTAVAAPVGLAGGMSAAAMAASAQTGAPVAILKFLAVMKLKTVVVVAVIAASVITPLEIQQSGQAKAAELDKAITQTSNRLQELTLENQRLSRLATQSRAISAPQFTNNLELLKLRDEVGRLTDTVRQMTAKPKAAPVRPIETAEVRIARLREYFVSQKELFKAWFEEHPSEKIPELSCLSNEQWLEAGADGPITNFALSASMMRFTAQAKCKDLLSEAFRNYVQNHDGDFPKSISDITPLLKSPLDDEILSQYQSLTSKELAAKIQNDPNVQVKLVSPMHMAVVSSTTKTNLLDMGAFSTTAQPNLIITNNSDSNSLIIVSP